MNTNTEAGKRSQQKKEEKMTENIAITVPNELRERIEKWKDQIDVSKVCQKALRTEIVRLEGYPRFGKDLWETLERLREDKRTSYEVGWKVGVEYVKKEVGLAELRRLRNLAFSLFVDLPPSCRDTFKRLTKSDADDEGGVDGESRDLLLNREEYTRGCGDGIKALVAFLDDKI